MIKTIFLIGCYVRMKQNICKKAFLKNPKATTKIMKKILSNFHFEKVFENFKQKYFVI